MLTPARKANSRWRNSPGLSGSIGWPSGRSAQAPERSFEGMMIGETPSPPCAGRDGPIDRRKERESVARRSDAEGIAGSQGGAPRKKRGQTRHAGLDDGIDVGISGDDIGKAGLRHRPYGEIIIVVGSVDRRRR